MVNSNVQEPVVNQNVKTTSLCVRTVTVLMKYTVVTSILTVWIVQMKLIAVSYSI